MRAAFALLLWLLIEAAMARNHDLRREVTAIKDSVAAIERKLATLPSTDPDKWIRSIENTLNSLLVKVSDISRKSQILNEIQQDNDVRRDLLHRISRNLEDLSRKQITIVGKKGEGDPERLDKLSENVQALFQIFGGMNRKIDDLQSRLERMHHICPTSDLKFFISKKIDSLTASTAVLSECLECDRESFKEVLQTFLRVPLENVANRCSQSDVEKSVNKMLDSKLKDLKEAIQSLIHIKFEKFRTEVQECNCMNDKNTYDGYSHDTPQELRAKEESNVPRETPGRIFRKLWRKMTEPINKVGERIESLAQTIESSNQKYYNETVTKLREWKSGESCSKQIQSIFNTTKDTAQRIGYIESRQLNMQTSVTKILSEVERTKGKVTVQVGNSAYIPPVTDAYVEGPIDGYLATSCADLQGQGTIRNGVYSLKPVGAAEPFLAYCDLETEGGGWTVIQRRGDFGEAFRQNFTQNWEMYKRGFGDPQREFWIGNEKMHWLSTQEDVKLRVELEDFEGNTSYAEYSRFKVEEESKQFRLSVGGYTGNATDSLSLHDGKLFSTHDRDNDEVASCCNCADTFKGGWWYYRCFEANLNGPYHPIPTENGYFLGIIWERWRGDYSLKSSEMKIRPMSFEEVQDP